VAALNPLIAALLKDTPGDVQEAAAAASAKLGLDWLPESAGGARGQ
jgi:hypothetical protein